VPDTVFETLPNVWVFAGVALGVVSFIAIMMCISRYLENEKDNACKRKDAILNGGTYDTVNEELSKKFWIGYLIVAIAGAVVSVGLGLLLTDLVSAYLAITDPERLLCLSVALGVGVWVIGDRYLFTRLGDSAYFARVESDAIKVFLGDTEVPTTTGESTEKVGVIELTDEQKRALVEALFKK